MKKKVLFVISTLNTGGAQRIISNLCTNLPEDYDIDILLNDAENIVYPYRGEIISLGLAPQADKMKLWYQLKVMIKRVLRLRKLKRKNHYDACISALESANLANILSGNKYCKTILSVHFYYGSGWSSKRNELLTNAIIKWTYNRADKVVTVAKKIEQDLVERLHVRQDKVLTIYNGYDKAVIEQKAQLPLDEKWNWMKDKKVIVTSGRLEEQKGQWHLIKAFSLIQKDVPETILVILGAGELKCKLEKLVNILGMTDRVIFAGFVENPFQIIKNSDLFILSSNFEGYPNALAEAIICGVPCISADCLSGPREMLQGKTSDEPLTGAYELAEYGILTPAFPLEEEWCNPTITLEEQVLAEAGAKMLQDIDLREFYLEKQKKLAEQLDMKNVIHEWIDLL